MTDFEQQAIALLTEIRDALGTKPTAAGTNGGAVFPKYGRSKGAPISGASKGDLEYYRSGCLRTLSDESKSKWWDKERTLLAAIESEMQRQRISFETEEPAAPVPALDFGTGPEDDAPPF